MRAEDLLTWIRQRRSSLFVFASTADDVRNSHPEMLRVGRTAANVYSFAGAPADPYEQMEMISLVLIESIAPVKAGHPV